MRVTRLGLGFGEGHDARVSEGEQRHEAEGVRQGDESVGPHLLRLRLRVRVGVGLGSGLGLGIECQG